MRQARFSTSPITTDDATPVYIASQNGQVACVKVLCKARADLNKGRNDGASPVCIASFNGHDHVLQVLLAAGTSILATVFKGAPPLHMAAEEGHSACVKVLAEIHPDSDTWRMFLLESGATRALEVYLALLPTNDPFNHLPRL